MLSLKSLFILATKNTFRKKLRTLLSIFGIILGILLYTSVGIASHSFQKEIQTSITYLQGAIFIQQKGVPTPVMSVLNRTIEYDLEKVFAGKLVGVSPQIWYVNGTSFTFSSMVVIGVYPEREILTGGYLSQADWSQREPPNDSETGWIVVGENIANMLGLKIGDKVKLGVYPKNITLTVINVFKIGGITDFLALASIKDIARIDRFRDLTHTVSSFIVKLRDPRETNSFISYVENKYPNVDIILEKDLATRASYILSNVEKFTLLIGGLGVIIGVLGVLNTVFMNVSERKKEIGILKATGWSNFEVLIEILFESLIMGLIGTIIGIMLGIYSVLLATEYFKLHFRLAMDLEFLVQPFLAGILISLIAGLPPAYSAMRISPIESLRE